jgi:hypothetical protein
MRRTLVRFVVAVGLMVAFTGSASAQNPFVADGVLVPDTGVPTTQDPQGSSRELGPVNGSPTKIGVINTAVPPMLEFTNPNGQVDLDAVYLQTRQALNGDQWLYFGWLRDSNNGSGFISIEFQQAALSSACVYTTAGIDFIEPESPAETNLINTCNPWRNRQTGDFIILWDQSGNVLDPVADIKKREFTCTGTTVPRTCVLGPIEDLVTVVAGISGDRFRGEMAINLTTEIFGGATSCLSFNNTLPGTVTGNSDTADYKDTVFAVLPPVTNCGILKVRKITLDPNGNPFTDTNNPAFGYTVSRTPAEALRFDADAANHPVDGAAPQMSIVRPNNNTPAGPSLVAGTDHIHTDLKVGTNYTLVEATPLPTPYVLVSIICADGTTGGNDITPPPNGDGGKFTVKVPSGTFEFTLCIITNQFVKTTPSLATTQGLVVRLFDMVNITGLTPVAPANRATSATFRLYSDNTCTTQVGSDITETLSYPTSTTASASIASTSGILVSVPGTYYWRVTYPGDTLNNAVTTACGLESTAVSATIIDNGPPPSPPGGGSE